jgi:hypothetical protein
MPKLTAATKKKAKAEKPKRGRPSSYTPALAAEICERLSKGEPLAAICRDEHMPHDSTVRDWMGAHANFSLAIARARESGFDAIAADCFEIADDARNDYMEKLANDGDGEAVKAMEYDAEHVQRSKLRIETRLKLLAKWDPKRYGERIHQEHSGELAIRSLADRMRKRAP